MTIQQQAALTFLLSCALTGAAQTSAPPVKDDLFAGTEKFAQGATSVTQIDMDPESLGKVEGKDGSKARRTVLSIVHTYEYDKPGMYKIEDVEEFRKKLGSGDWHCSVHVLDLKRGESTDVCQKRRADEMSEEAIITVEPKSLTFIHTVRRGGSWHGSSEVFLPLDIQFFGPEMRADMAVMQAKMQTSMAGMRPRLEGFAAGMKNFRKPDPDEMRRLENRIEDLDVTPQLTAPAAPPQP